jgi:diguanylate cyclase (GGDEF)-like protein
MNESAIRAGRLSAELLAMEDSIVSDTAAGLAAASDFERRALALGDGDLIARARLFRSAFLLRTGDVTGIARQIVDIHNWALAHGDRRLQSRTHLARANIERLCGVAAMMLEHTLSAVELLDEDATPYMQVFYHGKLADALAACGSMDAARLRYQQTEELARKLAQWERLAITLNNWAYAEICADDFPRAREVGRRMQEHATAHGIELDPTALDTIATIQVANGEYAQAEQTMRACLALREAGYSDDADDLARYLITLAQAQRGLGTPDLAQQNLDAARTLCVERDLSEVLVRVHQEQAELHAARGEFAAAFAMHKHFVAAHQRLHSQQREAESQNRRVMFETAEARELAEHFREQARRDPLTGLHNRRYIDEELPRLIAADPDLSVAILDLDHFKRINDELSHDAGDRVLARIARLLETELADAAPDGFVARLGGEEFLLVLPATPVGTAAVRLDRIRRSIRTHAWHAITGGLPVTVSIGVAGVHEAYPRDQAGTLSLADRHLYAAKRAGRDRVVASTCPDRSSHQALDAA